MTETAGRRERKKAQTRKALADAALRLFLEHGYDNVGVRDVAEAADVSVTTLFKHFSGKEALVFDEDQRREEALVSAVRDRAPGQPIIHALRDRALREYLYVHGDDPDFTAFIEMVRSTPALQEYSRRMWLRHETALAAAIAEATGAPEDDLAAAALARFALESAMLLRDRDDPPQALHEVFALLEHGWGDIA
ncbi:MULTISPECIES: TetR/AcrR family transcriptional regulator [Thermomonosporaceae]|uniref:TetR/AcrR family transcriptional regulator n=1 Tax=Thermomonosporaceae TaxID=2012 RepID=UPI00255B2618|nr:MULTISPECIES: TetR/AcrR family transcriptional regulator [Thermomonosporaceae]MDL4773883.1 helix-turn-helix domain-containing protein [Actinomadura xylanilytica]